MNWFNELLFGESVLHSCFIIALVGFIGVMLGKIRFGGIAFGVAFVFFTGIVLGHFGLQINPLISKFAQNFGLAIFIFSLGLQVGPSFFPSLRAGGVMLNVLSVCMLVLHIGLTIAIYFITGIPITQMVGVMCGAVNNSAALGAAQQAIIDAGGTESVASDMAMACATTYPFGVVSALIVIIILRAVFNRRQSNVDYESPIEKIRKKAQPIVAGIEISNPIVNGKTIHEVAEIIDRILVISQINRDGEIFVPNSDTELQKGDNILFTATSDDAAYIKSMLGTESKIDWVSNSTLSSRRIFVSKPEVNGKTLEALKIRKLFNVNVTYVNRAGIELVASHDLVLLVGDRVNVVGDNASLDRVEKMLGNAITKLEEPNLIVMFVGILVGIFVGSIPIFIPGISIPVKLGLTGGSIIIGILFGAFGYRLRLITYTTQSANLLLRELGIVLYLGCLGIDSGAGFVNTLVNGNGLQLVSWGVLISIVPMFIIGVVVVGWMKMDRATAYGMLCGSMASSQTLPYVNEITGKQTSAVAYSTVYPLTMFLRVITAQLIIMIFV